MGSCSSCGTAQGSGAIESMPGPDSQRYYDFNRNLKASVSARRVPTSGTIELIENCNFRCVHCYQGMQKHKEVLSAARWKGILDEVCEAGTLWLLITGGDPLLHPEFEEIYEVAIRKGLLVNLFTNGSLVREQHIELFKRFPPFNIEITLYGMDEETYRGVTGTKGSHAKVMEVCRRLVAAKLPLRLKTMAMKQTAPQIAAMKRFVEQELGVPFKFDTKIDPGIYGDDFSHVRIDPSEQVELEERVLGVAREALAQEYRGLWDDRAKLFVKNNLKDYLYYCEAGKASYYIDYRGWVHTCSIGRLWDEALDLSRHSFREIWDVKLPAVVNAKRRNQNAICHDCEYRSSCDVCPATAKLATGDREGRPLYICQVTMQRKLKYLEEQHAAPV